jgi:hypothetical protein
LPFGTWCDKLEAFKADHGHCVVPQRNADGLGLWVMTQRAAKNRLDGGHPTPRITLEQVEQLTELGMVWEVMAARFEARCAELEEFKAEHGDCLVPAPYPENPSLGRWVETQRRLKKQLDRGEENPGITQERVDRLTDVGMAWAGRLARYDAQFEARCAELEEFKVEHGDCLVPALYSENTKLGSWVRTQRRWKKRLDRGEENPGITQDRVDRLADMGMVWEVNRVSRSHGESNWRAVCSTFDCQFANLEAYQAKHGHCLVPQRSADGLGLWVMTQRAAKKRLDSGHPTPRITLDLVEWVTELGMVWEVTAGAPRVAWDERFEQLVAYKAVRGDCLVPTRNPDNPPLGHWVTRQRKFKRNLDRGDRKPGITQERVDALTAIGMLWWVAKREPPLVPPGVDATWVQQ